MWSQIRKSAENDNQEEISFFDVKELYDAAMAEKEKHPISFGRYDVLLAKAEVLDEAYRAQLGLMTATRYQNTEMGQAA